MLEYFREVENKVRVAYDVAKEARAKGYDPMDIVEIPLATNLAERVTGLISTIYPQIKDERIEKRIRELEKEYGLLDYAVSIIIAIEVASEKFCKFRNQLEAIDAGIRIGIAYTTLAVVSSPLEGFTRFELKKTSKQEDFFALYFSGPIRSAGGTAAAFSVLIADALREHFKYARYDATEQEARRAVAEIYDYHERVTNLQYLPSEKEIFLIAKFLPVMVTGDASEEKEVSNYKDLERIETNRIRGGFCLVMAEGIAQKASKLLKIVKELRKKGFSLHEWDFLQELLDTKKKESEEKKEKAEAAYIKDLVAGRPILSHPSRAGGFRLRYGKTRFSGFSSVAISPITMKILDDFIAAGSQLRTEMPGKSAAVTACDSIEGPIVKLIDGSVLKPKSVEEAERIRKQIKEIIYLGDVLISYGDFYNRNHILMPVGYTHEEWFSELNMKMLKNPKDFLHAKNSKEFLGEEEKGEKIEQIREEEINIEKAKEISEKYGMPLHPKFIFFWSQITKEQILALLEWLSGARYDNSIIFPYQKSKQEEFGEAKKALELLGIEHKITTENIVLEEQEAKTLALNLGIELENLKQAKEKIKNIKEAEEKNNVLENNTLKIINSLSNFSIKDKAGSFIGARMGRPEKAKQRELTGSPHVLFPVGEEGGRMRSVQKAEEKHVTADFPVYYCEKCKQETIYFRCENCDEKTKMLSHCLICGNVDSVHRHETKPFYERKIDIAHYLEKAREKLEMSEEEIPLLIKGVKGTSSAKHIPERMEKGILRAKFRLHVNKDGTTRYDATELVLTHFKPREIGITIEKLKELGYKHDVEGKPIENEEQLIEIKPQDVILPACPSALDEQIDEVFLRVAAFIDNLLVRLYKMRPFYNVSNREDLIGCLVACIAPHNAASVVGRIIGFSKIQALIASPYFHAAMRRDADGDEACVMLLLDTLINFSREFLPTHRGAVQDSPLIMNARIRAGEVDSMVFDIETVKNFPLAFYEAAEKGMMPSAISIEQIKDRLNTDREFKELFFTHDVGSIDEGVLCSAYKTLATMAEKTKKQLELAEKIRAVDESDVARLVIERHFMRDIKGNLRRFSTQQFRCTTCNKKYRRPPLAGKCECNGNIIFTVSEGTIIKYLAPAIELAKKYNVPSYVLQSLELAKGYIESIFGVEREKQQALQKWF